MALRVLVCVEDSGIAHVVAARLARDSLDCVVIDQPAKLVDEARKGVAAVAVQHRYPSGESGSSLLRQVRVARGEVVPAVVIARGEISGPDRLVYERQYKVQNFLASTATPVDIASAVRKASGAPADDELVLHEDERKNEFDISVESQARLPSSSAGSEELDLEAAFSGAFEDDDDESLKTVEISKAELARLKVSVKPPPAAMTQEGAGATDSAESSDLSRLPAPGGDNDFVLDDVEDDTANGPSPLGPTGTQESPPPAIEEWPAPTTQVTPRKPTPPPTPAAAPPSPTSDSSVAAPHGAAAEGEAMQIQELQRTQAELKKALLTERKSRETAQKRVEELEARLAKMGDAPQTSSQGVPQDGVFEDLRYPALLARFRSEAFTGALVMPSSGTTRTVYLKDGLPVAFSSSEPGQRIGKVLVAQGRITDEQYMKAATRMVEKSIKLTDALVELGLIDAESLDAEQRNLTRDQIIAGFELVQGRFTTQGGTVPDGNTPTFDFGPGEIYVQGFRRYAPANEMAAAYETLRDKYLVANARLASYRPKLGLSGDDERLLRLLGEALTVEEAVDRASLTTEGAARLLSALQALDLVEEWSPGVEQFRSRLRAERQRHAEELSQLATKHRQIEERLLKAFESALAGRGEAGGLQAALSEGRAEAGAAPSTPPPSAPPSSSSSSRTTKGLFDERPLPAASSSSSLSSGSSSSSSASSSSSSSSASSASAASAAAAASAPSAGGKWDAATSATGKPGATTGTPLDDSPAKPLSSLSSTLAAAMPPKEEVVNPADKKYREGIEQASQERLDEAEVTLREAVRLDATKPEFLTALARVLLANPRYERRGTLPVVRSLLDRAVTLQPDHQEASQLHKQVVAEMAGG